MNAIGEAGSGNGNAARNGGEDSPAERSGSAESGRRMGRTNTLGKYVLRRCLQLVPTTFGVLLLTFLLFHVVGGSPAEVVLGQHAGPASLAAFDAKYGYDKPLFFGHWADSRALNPEAGLAANRVVKPLFPLDSGEWRLVFPPASQAAVTALELAGPDGVSTQTVSHAEAGEHAAGRKPVFSVPDGATCTGVLIAGAGVADNAAEIRGVKLQRATKHFFDSQFVHYLWSLLRGDFGDSTAYGMKVVDVLKAGVMPSLTITVPILFGGTIIALFLAMTAAVWRGKAQDKAVLFGSTLVMSVNYVVWILAGQFFLSYKLRLFPIWGFENWTYIILPVIIGILSGLGRDIRFFRAVILDEMGKPYVRTALSKGLSRRRVLWGHVFRNSLIPVVTYVSLSIPYLFTGSLLLESFFGIPGLGGVSLNAVNSADMATVRAVVILGALLYQIVNLVTDLCYAWLDPRVKLS